MLMPEPLELLPPKTEVPVAEPSMELSLTADW